MKKPKFTAAKLHAEARRLLEDERHLFIGWRATFAVRSDAAVGQDWVAAVWEFQQTTLRIERQLRRKLAKLRGKGKQKR